MIQSSLRRVRGSMTARRSPQRAITASLRTLMPTALLQAKQPARSVPADRVALAHMFGLRPLEDGLHDFFEFTSLRIRMSRSCPATSRFKRRVLFFQAPQFLGITAFHSTELVLQPVEGLPDDPGLPNRRLTAFPPVVTNTPPPGSQLWRIRNVTAKRSPHSGPLSGASA